MKKFIAVFVVLSFFIVGTSSNIVIAAETNKDKPNKVKTGRISLCHHVWVDQGYSIELKKEFLTRKTIKN